jgi:muramoyltetrapeptide carboxypeptidase
VPVQPLLHLSLWLFQFFVLQGVQNYAFFVIFENIFKKKAKIMGITRRDLFKFSGAAMGAAALAKFVPKAMGEDLPVPVLTLLDEDRIIPPLLKKDSLVAITAPGSPTNTGECRFGTKLMKDNLCRVIYGDTVAKQKNEYKYLSQTDEFRAAEFMSFIENPDVNAIFAARGGYGSSRILDLLDFDKIKANPKLIIGFSDVTALLTAIFVQTNIVTYHGPVASSSFNEFSKSYFQKIIFENPKPEPIIYQSPTMQTITAGKATGRLIGGNLTVICGLMGTKYEIDTKDAILFLEDVSEDAYQIDRKLNQLKLAGKLDDASGIMFGIFKNLNHRRNFYPNMGYTIRELYDQYFAKYTKPIVFDVPFGHLENNLTLPIGTMAELDSKKGKLVLFNTL